MRVIENVMIPMMIAMMLKMMRRKRGIKMIKMLLIMIILIIIGNGADRYENGNENDLAAVTDRIDASAIL